MEMWSLENGRLFYSVFIFLLQLILPTVILIFAHAQIYQKLVSSKFLLRRRRQSSPELASGLSRMASSPIAARSRRSHRCGHSRGLSRSTKKFSNGKLNFCNYKIKLDNNLKRRSMKGNQIKQMKSNMFLK